MKSIVIAILGALLWFNYANASENFPAQPIANEGDVIAITDTDAAGIHGSAWSPNNFPKGQCTWYVDGKVKESSGWILKFSQSSGRDAYKWWDMVTNANKGQSGYKGDIMVFNKWSGNSYGHVAFVESSTPGSKWNITHANWKTGSSVRTIENYPIYAATFVKGNSGYVKLSGGSAQYPLRGFLYKK
jgi:surface antigen